MVYGSLYELIRVGGISMYWISSHLLSNAKIRGCSVFISYVYVLVFFTLKFSIGQILVLRVSRRLFGWFWYWHAFFETDMKLIWYVCVGLSIDFGCGFCCLLMLYLVSGFLLFVWGCGLFEFGPVVIPAVPYLSCGLFSLCSVVFQIVGDFAVCASGLLLCTIPIVKSSFTICWGIVVVYMWDFKWVVCLVNMVSDWVFGKFDGLYLFYLFRDFCV